MKKKIKSKPKRRVSRSKKAKKKASVKLKKIKPVSLKAKKTGKNEFAPERIDQLLEKGKTRGFVTYAEILHMFPHIEDNVIFLDELYTRFQAGGVGVFGGGEKLEGKGKKKRKKAPGGPNKQI